MSSEIIQDNKQPSFWQRLDRMLLPEDNEVVKRATYGSVIWPCTFLVGSFGLLVVYKSLSAS